MKTSVTDAPRKPKKSAGAIARRTFLVAAGVLGGGVLVGAGVVAARLSSIDSYKLPAGEGEASFGAWLKFARDGKVEVVVPHQEMGQGIYALAILLVAEGLDLPPEAIRAVPAPIEARFANPVMLADGLPIDDAAPSAMQRATLWTFTKILKALGIQGTGGSTSTRNIAEPIRMAAAVARDMFLRAAASRFNAPVDQLRAIGGTIVAPDGKSATYGELADDAARLAPREIALAPLAPGQYIGRGAPRFYVPLKAEGRARFGIDTREKDQLYAAIRHAPRLGATSPRASLASNPPGVRGLVEGKTYVAVVAESYAIAAATLEKLDVVWDESHALKVSTADIFKSFRAALDKGQAYQPRWVLDSAGEAGKAQGKTLKATYTAPLLAHVAMEPINATALVTDTSAKVWTSHQSASLVQMIAASAAGLPGAAVEVATPFVGGGLGRRSDLGYVAIAVEIAKKFKGLPVQTIWSREQDIRDDVFRPAAMADRSAVLDASGLPTSFIYRIATPSVVDQFTARAMPSAKGGLMADRTTVDGAIFPIYAFANRSIENFTVDAGVPVGFWRSVGFSLNCFFVECFVDELAHAAGAAPLVFRARLLGAAGSYTPALRASKVLERMAAYDAAHPLPATQKNGAKVGRGFALTECFKSFVGQIADVEITGSDIKVLRVHAVVDCGFAIDPPNVVAQVRGGVNHGLSAALFGRIDLEGGAIVQTNFDSYPIMTLDNAPDITVDILNSGAEIGGVGEIGVPAIAPAVGNAIFAATGQRLRALPFALAGA